MSRGNGNMGIGMGTWLWTCAHSHGDMGIKIRCLKRNNHVGSDSGTERTAQTVSYYVGAEHTGSETSNRSPLTPFPFEGRVCNDC